MSTPQSTRSYQVRVYSCALRIAAQILEAVPRIQEQWVQEELIKDIAWVELNAEFKAASELGLQVAIDVRNRTSEILRMHRKIESSN